MSKTDEEVNLGKNDRKTIYIALTYTGTRPSRLIRFFTNEPYSHVSIAFDSELCEMYSFARRGIWNPLNAGFVEEDLESGIFGRHKSTACNIYELNITEEQYIKLRQEINVFISNKLKYSYNFLGVVGAALNVPIQRKQRYFCSQFVAYVLERSGIQIFNKNCALVKPEDIRTNQHLKSIYTGKLILYRSSLECSFEQ